MFAPRIFDPTRGARTPTREASVVDSVLRVALAAAPSTAVINERPTAVESAIPVEGNPVALVSVTDAGVPRTGVVRVGEVSVLLVSVWVAVVVTTGTPLAWTIPVPLVVKLRLALVSGLLAVRRGVTPVGEEMTSPPVPAGKIYRLVFGSVPDTTNCGVFPLLPLATVR